MKGNRRWQQIYRDWKLKNPEINIKQRRDAIRGCIRKLAHPDILSALGHASVLPRHPRKVPNVYICEICSMLHVGNRTASSRQSHRLGFIGDERSDKFAISTKGGDRPIAIQRPLKNQWDRLHPLQ